MSPSCTTDPCPSTRMRASRPSPPLSLTLMTSLDRGWTSVLLTLSDLTACMTVVGIPEVLLILYHFLRKIFKSIVFSSQHTHSTGPVLIWTDQHLWNDPEGWEQLKLGPNTEHSSWHRPDIGGALQRYWPHLIIIAVEIIIIVISSSSISISSSDGVLIIKRAITIVFLFNNVIKSVMESTFIFSVIYILNLMKINLN